MIVRFSLRVSLYNAVSHVLFYLNVNISKNQYSKYHICCVSFKKKKDRILMHHFMPNGTYYKYKDD